jgi:hypothetical protein
MPSRLEKGTEDFGEIGFEIARLRVSIRKFTKKNHRSDINGNVVFYGATLSGNIMICPAQINELIARVPPLSKMKERDRDSLKAIKYLGL